MNDSSAVTDKVVVEKITSSAQLDAVKTIYREHKSTLGLMPDGAFDDRLVACSPKTDPAVMKVESQFWLEDFH